MLYTNKASSITIYIYIVAITLNDSLVLVLRDRGSFEIWLVDDLSWKGKMECYAGTIFLPKKLKTFTLMCTMEMLLVTRAAEEISLT